MFNEGNQIHNFMSSSGSGTVITVLRIWIRDPGSGIGYLFDPWIRDPGSGILKKLRFRFRFQLYI
jgi:hypothetical protein